MQARLTFLVVRTIPSMFRTLRRSRMAAIAAVTMVWATTVQPAYAQSPRLIRPELEVGVQDSSVAELQATLKLLGFYDGSVTGTFSPQTSEAVARFQQAAGLPNTGRVGRRTWETLFPPGSGSGAIVAGNPAASSVTQPTAQPLPTPRPPVLRNEPTTPAPRPVSRPAPRPVERPAERPTEAASPTPAAARPDPDNPFPILREGAEGDAVARLQHLLQQQDFFSGAIDGDFGPMTLEAVIAAQENLGLEADGVVGPATWEALRR